MTPIIESENKVFMDYEIIVNEDGKYGIKDSAGNLIIDCVFDNIEWIRDDNLVIFRTVNRYALCLISDIEKYKAAKRHVQKTSR